VSILAVVGLVLAIVPCCPFTGLIGAFLGVLALRRIRVAGGALGGRRVAIVAIIAGVASSIIWTIWFERLRGQLLEANEQAMTERITETVRAAASADVASAARGWVSTPSTRPTDQQLEEFGEAISTRYGDFERVAIVSSTPRGSMFDPAWEVACIFHFSDAAPLGSALFETRIEPGRMTPVFELARLVIEDRERGDLTIGEPPVRRSSPSDREDEADQPRNSQSQE
jgi:hypothetical protein